MTPRAKWLVLPAIAIAALHVGWAIAGGLGRFASFPLDDAWIHQVFARSIAAGEGFRYAGHVPSAGCSSPLWAMVLALPAALRLEPVLTGAALGVALSVVASIAGGLWASHIAADDGQSPDLRVAALGIVIVGANPIWAWNAASGMEGPAATAALLVAGCLRAHERPYAAAFLFGCAGALRFEALLVLPALLVENMALRRGLRRAFTELAVAALVPLVAMVALRVSTGAFLPHTLEAKVGDRVLWRIILHSAVRDWGPEIVQRLLSGFVAVGKVLLSAAPLQIMLVLFASLRLRERRRSWLAVLILVSQPIGMELLPQPGGALNHEGRYVVHLLALAGVLATVGAVECFVRARDEGRPWLAGALVLVVLVNQLVAGAFGALRCRNDRRWIASEHVAMGRWISAHTHPGEVVAMRDVGAVGYFAPQVRVLDLLGLVSPEVVDARRSGRPFVLPATVRYVGVFRGELSSMLARCRAVREFVEPSEPPGRTIMSVYDCSSQ